MTTASQTPEPEGSAQGPLVSQSSSRWYRPKLWHPVERFFVRQLLGKKIYNALLESPLFEETPEEERLRLGSGDGDPVTRPLLKDSPVVQLMFDRQKIRRSIKSLSWYGVAALFYPVLSGALLTAAPGVGAFSAVSLLWATLSVSFKRLELTNRNKAAIPTNDLRLDWVTKAKRLIIKDVTEHRPKKGGKKIVDLWRNDIPKAADALGTSIRNVVMYRINLASVGLIPFVSAAIVGEWVQLLSTLPMLTAVLASSGVAIYKGGKQTGEETDRAAEMQRLQEVETTEADGTILDVAQQTLLRGLSPARRSHELRRLNVAIDDVEKGTGRFLQFGLDAFRVLRNLSMTGMDLVTGMAIFFPVIFGIAFQFGPFGAANAADVGAGAVVLLLPRQESLVLAAIKSFRSLAQAVHPESLTDVKEKNFALGREIFRGVGLFDLTLETESDLTTEPVLLKVSSEAGLVQLFGDDEAKLSELLQMLAGDLEPNNGVVTLSRGDKSLRIEDAKEAYLHIGYLPKNAGFLRLGKEDKEGNQFPVTVRDQLQAYAKVSEVRLRDAWQRFDISLEKLDWSIERLNASEQRVVAVLRLLLANHQILILDHPENLMTYKQAPVLEQMLIEASTERKLVMVSPDMEPDFATSVTFKPDSIFVVRSAVREEFGPYPDSTNIPPGLDYVGSFKNRPPWASRNVDPTAEVPHEIDQRRAGHVRTVPWGEQRGLKVVPVFARTGGLPIPGAISAIEILKAAPPLRPMAEKLRAGAKKSERVLRDPDFVCFPERPEYVEPLDRFFIARQIKAAKRSGVEMYFVPTEFIHKLPENCQVVSVADYAPENFGNLVL